MKFQKDLMRKKKKEKSNYRNRLPRLKNNMNKIRNNVYLNWKGALLNNMNGN